MQGKTDLYIVQNGTLTAARYGNEILGVYVRPYAGAICPDFILMDNNARPHRAWIISEYLQSATIEIMDCQGHAVQTAISVPSVQATTVRELQRALLDEWVRIPQQSIRRLISGMRTRSREVIQSNGQHTRYLSKLQAPYLVFPRSLI